MMDLALELLQTEPAQAPEIPDETLKITPKKIGMIKRTIHPVTGKEVIGVFSKIDANVGDVIISRMLSKSNLFERAFKARSILDEIRNYPRRANVKYIKENNLARLIAIRPIKKGQELLLNYRDSAQSLDCNL